MRKMLLERKQRTRLAPSETAIERTACGGDVQGEISMPICRGRKGEGGRSYLYDL